MEENSVDRRFFLSLTATTGIGLTLSPARVFAQGPATSPEMSALSAYMSAAGARALIADYMNVPLEMTARMQLPAFYEEAKPADLQLVFDLAARFGIVPKTVAARSETSVCSPS